MPRKRKAPHAKKSAPQKNGHTKQGNNPETNAATPPTSSTGSMLQQWTAVPAAMASAASAVQIPQIPVGIVPAMPLHCADTITREEMLALIKTIEQKVRKIDALKDTVAQQARENLSKMDTKKSFAEMGDTAAQELAESYQSEIDQSTDQILATIGREYDELQAQVQYAESAFKKLPPKTTNRAAFLISINSVKKKCFQSDDPYIRKHEAMKDISEQYRVYNTWLKSLIKPGQSDDQPIIVFEFTTAQLIEAIQRLQPIMKNLVKETILAGIRLTQQLEQPFVSAFALQIAIQMKEGLFRVTSLSISRMKELIQAANAEPLSGEAVFSEEHERVVQEAKQGLATAQEKIARLTKSAQSDDKPAESSRPQP